MVDDRLAVVRVKASETQIAASRAVNVTAEHKHREDRCSEDAALSGEIKDGRRSAYLDELVYANNFLSHQLAQNQDRGCFRRQMSSRSPRLV